MPTEVKPIYKTTVVSRGGRNGTIRSEDGLLDMQLSLPPTLGGQGTSSNPEQLFAGGYAACFANAVIHIARAKRIHLSDKDVEVSANVSLSQQSTGGFVLSVSLDTVLVGLVQSEAEQLVHEAHAVCPYSNAVRGNIDVEISVATR